MPIFEKKKYLSPFAENHERKLAGASFYVLAGVVFILVLLTSEFIYIYNNKPDILSVIFLKKAQFSLKSNSNPNATKDLFKAANFIISSKSKDYKQIPRSFFPDLAESEKMNEIYMQYLPSMNTEEIIKSEKYDLPRVFYDIAILAYEQGETKAFLKFLQAAIYMNPELSHLHVEMANYYLYEGNIEKADEAISFCFEFNSPVKHCRDYKENMLEKDLAEYPGFLSKELEKYYEEL